MVLGVVAIPSGLWPQAEVASTRDIAVVSVTLEDLVPGSGGASLSADWIHSLPHGTITAGLASVTVGGVRWAVGRFGGAWRMHPRVLGETLVSLGPGSLAGEGFFYRHVRAAVSYAAIPSRLLLDGEGQAFDIAPFQGEILAAGITVLPRRGLMTRLSYGRSVGGNYDADYLLMRADLRNGRIGGLGGFSAGKSGPKLEDLTLTGSPASPQWEIFAGAVVPLYGVEWTVVLSHTWGEVVRRESIVLTSRIPLR
jgi:hypothetical protein